MSLAGYIADERLKVTRSHLATEIYDEIRSCVSFNHLESMGSVFPATVNLNNTIRVEIWSAADIRVTYGTQRSVTCKSKEDALREIAKYVVRFRIPTLPC